LPEPVIQPRLLMPLALPAVPPSSPSSTTWYLDWAASRTGIAVAANKVIAIMHDSIRGFMLSPSLSASAPRLSDRTPGLYSFYFQGQRDVSAEKS
jgi:hypothetical protein